MNRDNINGMFSWAPNHNEEEISVHVEPQTRDDFLPAPHHNWFDVVPFRQTFFRYNLYGQSEVVKSSSLVYASHHSSQATWLDIKKLSVVLVGNNEIPNLGLFIPTVQKVHFMGHITYPTAAFGMLPQLTSLNTVSFNIGFGGYINEFQETTQEFHQSTPEVPSVTSLEIKLNHNLYQVSPEETKSTFNRLIKSIIKHSSDSFPNLQNVSIDLPNTVLFYHSTALLLHGKENLRPFFEIIRSENKVQVQKKPIERPVNLAFDPCAYLPTNSQYNLLRLIDIDIRSFNTSASHHSAV